MKELSLRQKETLDLLSRIKTMKQVTRRWFYYAGVKFLQSHDLTDEQEDFLEEISEFYMDNLSNIEKDKTFLHKIEFGPIVPVKKK